MLNTTEGSPSSLDSQASVDRADTLAVSISLQKKKIPFVYQNLFALVEKLLSSLI